MENLTSRDRQAINTKATIIKAAIDLIKVAGLDNVKITDICDIANVSVGTFYHHFKSKESIIESAYLNVDMSIEAQVEKRDYNSFREKILIIFQEANKNISDLGYRFMADMLKFDLSNTKKYSIKNSRYPYNAIESAIESGIIADEFKSDVDPAAATHDFMRIGRGAVVDWCLHEGRSNLIAESENIVAAYLDFIAKN